LVSGGLGDESGLSEQRINKSRFAMINMGDNGYVSKMGRIGCYHN